MLRKKLHHAGWTAGTVGAQGSPREGGEVAGPQRARGGSPEAGGEGREGGEGEGQASLVRKGIPGFQALMKGRGKTSDK